jgi:hypothetical protein
MGKKMEISNSWPVKLPLIPVSAYELVQMVDRAQKMDQSLWDDLIHDL